MTENEIKAMLKDIIDNGADYECRPIGRCSNCVNCRLCDWRNYKLGDEIHDNYEYRKLHIWSVVKFTDKYSVCLKSGLTNDAITYFEGTREECEKWVEENTKTWLEGYLENDYFEFDSEMYIAESSIKEVCKKILEEVRTNEGIEQMTKFYIGEIIKDLGVEV